jgi:phosphatidylinositol glycan class A protein
MVLYARVELLLAGGDGPKLIEILQMREKHLLQDRIQLLGPVRPSDVRDVSAPPR